MQAVLQVGPRVDSVVESGCAERTTEMSSSGINGLVESLTPTVSASQMYRKHPFDDDGDSGTEDSSYLEATHNTMHTTQNTLDNLLSNPLACQVRPHCACSLSALLWAGEAVNSAIDSCARQIEKLRETHQCPYPRPSHALTLISALECSASSLLARTELEMLHS